MAKLDEQISTLQERLTQLKLKQQRHDTRKRALDAQREKKLATRRHLLVGELIMTKVQQGEFDARVLRSWLDATLTRDSHRALFDSELRREAHPHSEAPAVPASAASAASAAAAAALPAPAALADSKSTTTPSLSQGPFESDRPNV